MKVFFKVSLLILILIKSSANAKEAPNIKQFDDWQLVCAKFENTEKCEVSQFIIAEELKLQFKIVYQILTDEKTKRNYDVFSIITPLGVNLIQQAALLFPNSEEQINLSFVKCEVFSKDNLIVSGSGIWKSANWKNVQAVKEKILKDDGGW